MTRSRASAKKAGTSFETAIATYLASTVDDRICRQTKTGAADRGDIANLRLTGGQHLVMECKNTARPALAEWQAEAERERQNADAYAAIICHKRHGVSHATRPGEQWVTMTLDTLAHIITAPQEGQTR